MFSLLPILKTYFIMKSNQVITLLLMLLFFKSTNCDSQTYSLFGDKCFGGNGYEQNLRMINFNENLFVIGSSKSNPLTGNHTDSSCIFSSVPVDGDIWAVKFNSSFNILNDKSLGGNKEENDIDKIIRTSTNNIIFSCISNSDSSCDKSEFNVNFPLANNDFWICCIDSNGNKIWDKTLGGFGTESSSMVIELTDGNYVVAGSLFMPINHLISLSKPLL